MGLPEHVYFQFHFKTSIWGCSYNIKKIVLTIRVYDFDSSVSSIKRVFTGCVRKIANNLQRFIFWPQGDKRLSSSGVYGKM